jgi:hypothetical protein
MGGPSSPPAGHPTSKVFYWCCVLFTRCAKDTLHIIAVVMTTRLEGPPPVTNPSERGIPLRRDLWPRALACWPWHEPGTSCGALST